MMREELDKELCRNRWTLSDVLAYLDDMLEGDELDIRDIAGDVRRAFLLPRRLAIAAALFWCGYRYGLGIANG